MRSQNLMNDKKRRYFRYFNICYMNSIQHFKNSMKTFYNTCSQDQCPAIRRRLEYHMMLEHGEPPPGPKPRWTPQDPSTPLVPRSNRQISTKTGNDIQIHDTQTNGAQTDTQTASQSNGKAASFNSKRDMEVSFTSTSDSLQSSMTSGDKSSETIDSKESKSSNEYLLNKVIREWMNELPLYPEAEVNKDSMVNDLLEIIGSSDSENSEENPKDDLRSKIEWFIDSTRMWYPGAKRDQATFKNDLVNKLLNNLKRVNLGNKQKSKVANEIATSGDVYVSNNESKNDNELECENKDLEVIVEQWVMETDLDEYCKMNLKDIKKVVLRRISPLLKIPVKKCNCKIILSNVIMDILNNLPVYKCVVNKNRYFENCAEELLNKLVGKRDSVPCSTYTNMERASCKFDEIFELKPDCIMPKLTESRLKIYKEVDKHLKNMHLDINYGLKHEITEIVKDYSESSHPMKNYFMKKEIISVLINETHIKKSLAIHLAKVITRRNIDSLDVSKTTSVFACEQCSTDNPVTSTPKKKREMSTPKLNAEEQKYTEKVGDLIRAWMDTLPEQFNDPEEKNFKDVIIGDLAGDIMDEIKLEQVAPGTRDDRDKYLKYLVNKWILKLDVFELEEVAPQVEVFLEKLKDVPVPIMANEQQGCCQDKAQKQIPSKTTSKPSSNAKKNEQQTPRIDTASYTCCGKDEKIESENIPESDSEVDGTIKECITKFIKRDLETYDPLAKGAYSYLLKKELLQLNHVKDEVCDNTDQKETDVSPEHLSLEFAYINAVSDWLKNMPVDAEYNSVGNKERVDFVIGLAKVIIDLEEAEPCSVECHTKLTSTIKEYIQQLPITEEHKNDKDYELMTEQLTSKITTVRKNTHEIGPNDTFDTTGVNTDNIGDFIEEFLRVNGSEIADDEIKMEAWSVRLIREIKKMIREADDDAAPCKAEVYDKIKEVPIPGDDTIEQFDLELLYVREIAEWIKNLPLTTNEDEDDDDRTRMIANLAEQLAEIQTRNANDNDTLKEMQTCITDWIAELPLDKDKTMVLHIVVEQLIYRIKNAKLKDEPKEIIIENKDVKKTDSKNKGKGSKQCCAKKKSSKIDAAKNPANLIVDAIKKWSNSLPIPESCAGTKFTVKEYMLKKCYQKISELNINQTIFNDDLLYQHTVANEIERMTENIEQTADLQKNNNELIQAILDAKPLIKEKSAGDEYKHRLEDTIEASIPNPASHKKVYDPGFEIYKHRLADMFILDNFDLGIDEVRDKYERRLKKEIDKHFDSAKNKNAVPIGKDEIYNELYSALFKVPIPNESSVVNEVEEVKTRCVIDTWFEELPLTEANGLVELLERDQILSTLTKRIRDLEKEPKSDDKIHKEIIKWLEKLPMKKEEIKNTDKFATQLKSELKSTAEQRKCVLQLKPDKKGKKKGKCKQMSKKKSQSKTCVSNDAPVEPAKPPKKKAADLIIETVEEWCSSLPLSSYTPLEEELAKHNLATKIIIKISELNMNPETFNNDFLYEDILDQELDTLLNDVQTCCDFERCKDARKTQLKEAMKTIRPIVNEENELFNYKRALNRTVDEVLKKPENLSADKETQFKAIKEDVIDEFLQIHFDRDGEETIQHKVKVYDDVLKYSNMKPKEEKLSNPLIKRNQLLCELEKIPSPKQELLESDIAEIRIKNEIAELFSNLSIKPDERTSQIKASLAKKLNDIEKLGYTQDNEAKMKKDVEKSLSKLGKQCKPDVIEAFIQKLKDNLAAKSSVSKSDSSCSKSCPMLASKKSKTESSKESVKECKIKKDKNPEPKPKPRNLAKSSETKRNCQICEIKLDTSKMNLSESRSSKTKIKEPKPKKSKPTKAELKKHNCSEKQEEKKVKKPKEKKKRVASQKSNGSASESCMSDTDEFSDSSRGRKRKNSVSCDCSDQLKTRSGGSTAWRRNACEDLHPYCFRMPCPWYTNY